LFPPHTAQPSATHRRVEEETLKTIRLLSKQDLESATGVLEKYQYPPQMLKERQMTKTTRKLKRKFKLMVLVA
jgi:hypothetical protein